MATITPLRPLLTIRSAQRTSLVYIVSKQSRVAYSTVTQIAKEGDTTSRGRRANKLKDPSGLERLPTSGLLRNLFLGFFITTPVLFRPGFAVLKRIANSKSFLLNPDSNPVLRALIKPLVYDQFCAGRDRTEICQTKQTIKSMGYSGVILGYGKELQVTPSNNDQLLQMATSENDAELEEWAAGNVSQMFKQKISRRTQAVALHVEMQADSLVCLYR